MDTYLEKLTTEPIREDTRHMDLGAIEKWAAAAAAAEGRFGC